MWVLERRALKRQFKTRNPRRKPFHLRVNFLNFQQNLQRPWQIPDFFENKRKAGQSPEMTRLAAQHHADIGNRRTVEPRHIIGRGTRIVAFGKFRRMIHQRGQVDPLFVEHKRALPDLLKNVLRPGDILITQGAGDVGGIALALAGADLKLDEVTL